MISVAAVSIRHQLYPHLRFRKDFADLVNVRRNPVGFSDLLIHADCLHFYGGHLSRGLRRKLKASLLRMQVVDSALSPCRHSYPVHKGIAQFTCCGSGQARRCDLHGDPAILHLGGGTGRSKDFSVFDALQTIIAGPGIQEYQVFRIYCNFTAEIRCLIRPAIHIVQNLSLFIFVLIPDISVIIDIIGSAVNRCHRSIGTLRRNADQTGNASGLILHEKQVLGVLSSDIRF